MNLPTDRTVASLDGVSVVHGSGSTSVRAVDDVSLSIKAGSSLAITGRSGSGKSTLIGVLGLMRSPTTGTVSVVDGHLPRYQRVGMVFQSFHLEPHLTAEENCMLAWFCGPSTMKMTAARALARELLNDLGVAQLAERKTGSMSGGERQRVAIARALFGNPALLIADEPTGNLDEDNAGLVRDLLFALPSQRGTAVVVVTHDNTVAAGAQRNITLSKGRVAL